MEFIQEEDLELITTCANQDVNDDDFVKLKVVYEKLEHICVLLKEEGFDYQIRKDPRRQAGQGVFKFQEYHWAKIYPSQYKQFAQDKFAYIIGFTDVVHFHLMGIKEYQEKQASKEASKACWTELYIEGSSYEEVVENFVEFDKKYRNLFIKTGAALGIEEFKNIVIVMRNAEIKKLLEYKKQIILQGPPGTGKTRKAKEIARELLLPNEITEENIRAAISVEQKIKSATDYTAYTIKALGDVNITVGLANGISEYKPSYKEIITAYNIQMWNGKQEKGNDPYAAAIAKYIYENYLPENQFKLIQFHPSYSYEDFVRGISAKPNGSGIAYQTEDKTLGKFAAEALKNYRDSKQPITTLSKENWINKEIELFAEKVQEEIDKAGSYAVNETVSIYSVEDDAFRYKGNTWDVQSLQRMKFKDIVLAYSANAATRQEVKQVAGISGRAREHASYDFKLLEKFREFLATRPTYIETEVKVDKKNYVLIIDEINRANLSSVLGELIYALEYRSEAVESMYAVDGDNKLVLPPNLYIIGTMNTADRSVGNIDYAIRRRFAFVDVLPTIEPITVGREKFKQVSELFIKSFDNINWDKLEKSEHLAADFRPDDVWLGHSYFITQDKDENGNAIAEQLQQQQLHTKLKYEVLPILKEYVKDGILLANEAVNNVIDELSAIK